MLKPNNIVILTGNIGKAPETRELDNGTAVTRFSLATNDGYKDKGSGEWVNQTEWHTVVAWRATAEYIGKHFVKGTKCQVLGKLTHRKYTDSNGTEKWVTEVVVESISKLSKEQQDSTGFPAGGPKSQGREQPVPTQDETGTGPEPGDDLPF